MSTSDKAKGFKTLAIRLDDDLHAQLSVIAQLSGSSIADEIRQAIDAHLEVKRSNPELSDRAAAVLEDIERQAQARQQAIAKLFDQPTGRKRSTRSGSTE